MKIGGKWSPVRTLYKAPNANYFDPSTAALVACRQLGFSQGEESRGSGGNAPPILLDTIYCEGTEKSLSECVLERDLTASQCALPGHDCGFSVLECLP